MDGSKREFIGYEWYTRDQPENMWQLRNQWYSHDRTRFSGHVGTLYLIEGKYSFVCKLLYDGYTYDELQYRFYLPTQDLNEAKMQSLAIVKQVIAAMAEGGAA